jgi:hypothetical protein
MTVFILPKTILNVPTKLVLPNAEVSLNEYIKKFNKTCIHDCVPYSTVVHDIVSKYNLSSSIKYTTNDLEGVYPVLVNNTDVLNSDVLYNVEVGGAFISKIKDSTSYESIQFLFKLSSCFKTIYLCKPECICNVSSIKYVIAVGFHHVPSTGHFEIPYYFKNCIDEMNSTFGQTQLEHLRFSKK